MSDLWVTASADAESEHLHRHVTAARVAAAPVWPFLAAAVSPEDYANRKALSSERIERIAAAVAESDPALFGVVHASLLDGFDTDFTVLHTERLAARMIEASKTREEQHREATLRAHAAEQAVRQVLSAGLENLGDEKAEPFTEEDGEEDTTKESAKTASTYCPNHGVYVGEGNSEQHNECTKEQRKSKDSAKVAYEEPTNSWPCQACPRTVERYRGQYDVACDCGAQYNASGQRLRDDWADNASNWDSEVGDMEGYEDAAIRNEREGSRKTGARIDALRRILQNKQHETMEGVLMDTFTASALVQVYDALSPANQAKFDSIPLDKLAALAFSVTGSKTAGENPFATKKPADNADAGAPDAEQTESTSWTCPNCQGTDAYTQEGKDLAEALKASEPIKCGSCQQVDTSGGQAANQQQTPQPGVPATARRRRPFGSRTAAARPVSEMPETYYEVCDDDEVIYRGDRAGADRVNAAEGDWRGHGPTVKSDGTKGPGVHTVGPLKRDLTPAEQRQRDHDRSASRRTAAVAWEDRDPDQMMPACANGRCDDDEDYRDTTCVCTCHDHWGVPLEYREGWEDEQYHPQAERRDNGQPHPKIASRRRQARRKQAAGDPLFDVALDPTRDDPQVSFCTKDPNCNVTGNAAALAAHYETAHTPMTDAFKEKIADAIERGLNQHVRQQASKTAAGDPTQYGVGGDHCPHCGSDWKRPCDGDCPRNTNPALAAALEAEGEKALSAENAAWRAANPGPHTCPVCSGTGTSMGGPCRNCGGKGSWTYTSSKTAAGTFAPGDKVIYTNWNGAEAPATVIADPAPGMAPSFVDVDYGDGIPIPQGRDSLRKASSKTAANPYEQVGNPYVNDPPTQPGTPDDLLDGPRDTNPLSNAQEPVTTRPRQQPSGAPAEMTNRTAPAGVQQGFASLSTLQETS